MRPTPYCATLSRDLTGSAAQAVMGWCDRHVKSPLAVWSRWPPYRRGSALRRPIIPPGSGRYLQMQMICNKRPANVAERRKFATTRNGKTDAEEQDQCEATG